MIVSILAGLCFVFAVVLFLSAVFSLSKSLSAFYIRLVLSMGVLVLMSILLFFMPISKVVGELALSLFSVALLISIVFCLKAKKDRRI